MTIICKATNIVRVEVEEAGLIALVFAALHAAAWLPAATFAWSLSR